MIYIFRKEMKKWHTVLWLVFISLGLSGVSFFWFRPKHATEITVAHVNGYPVYFDEYRKSLVDIQERINSLRQLARMYGMSEEMFLSTFLGAIKPEEQALDSCVSNKLIDYVKSPFNIVINETWFKNELIKTLPQLADEQGRINMEMYQRYLQRISTTPSEYEKQRREDFARDIANRFIGGLAYVPNFITSDALMAEKAEKSFIIASFTYEHFLSEVKKTVADDKALDQFYLTNKENYRVGEKRKAKYWELSPERYAQTLELDAQAIRNFYEKHKGSLYRVPPKIKVRHILIKLGADKAHETIKNVHRQATSQPDKFEALAKQYSQDEKTASKGGLIDFFGKGSYDADFEKAAFRLKTEGEISPIVKTKQGYEIIQLVQRISASEKSFDSVKDEIAKTLRAKRSLAALRGELEFLMRSIHEDPKALDQFIQKHELTAKETNFIMEGEAKEHGLEAQLAKRLFSAHKRQSSVGYFINDEVYIIYQLSGVEKSYLPQLEQIREKLANDFYSEKAESLAKNTLKEARSAILAKRTDLQQIAEKNDGHLIKTGKIKKGDKIVEVDDEANATLCDKLFMLTDPSQVLEYRHKNIFYLAQISAQEPADKGIIEKERQNFIKQEKYKASSLYPRAFIASLYRNAKIEIDRKILETQHVDMKD